MATTRKAGRRKAAGSKPAPRARRVVVAKAKSSSRAKASAKSAAGPPRRATPAASRPAKARAAKPRPGTSPTSRLAAVPPSPPVPRKRQVSRPAGSVEVGAPPPPLDAAQEVALTDEERIESAKYLPRRAPARVFEEERFIFPQTYGVNRLRLLVKDPEWLFAYWDVDPGSLASLRADLGERASALSQLTLRVFEDRGGGASTFLLPQDARTWYVPTRSAGRAYRAEVGVILPTGEFRPLAQSNSVVTPRGARSSQKAKKTVRYDRARPLGQAAPFGPSIEEAAASAADEPWSPPLDAGAGPEEARPKEERSRTEPRRGGKPVERGGASDLHRR
jgi:hypothetical protein